jgi:glycosyltransferase involved in cell wall biosynthesis
LGRVENFVSLRGERVGFNMNQALNLLPELSRYDLIFATADSSALPVLFLKSLGKLSVPVVYATIGLAEVFQGSERSLFFRFIKRLLPFAERIIYYGYGEGPILRDLFGVPDEMMSFVPLGTEHEFFLHSRNQAPEDYILSLGIDRRRDWHTFLKAAKGLEARFRLICDPSMLAGRYIPDNVEVEGRISMVEVRERLAKARFVVLPVVKNCYTAASFTLLQSMAAGKPVIVSRTTAIEGGYNFASSEECIMVPPEDWVQLRLAIKALLADPARCADMGQKASERIEEEYTIEKFSSSLVRIFEEVLT